MIELVYCYKRESKTPRPFQFEDDRRCSHEEIAQKGQPRSRHCQSRFAHQIRARSNQITNSRRDETVRDPSKLKLIHQN